MASVRWDPRREMDRVFDRSATKDTTTVRGESKQEEVKMKYHESSSGPRFLLL